MIEPDAMVRVVAGEWPRTATYAERRAAGELRA